VLKMVVQSMAMIYFSIQKFGHLHSIRLMDFNWAKAYIIVNGLMLDTLVLEGPGSPSNYASRPLDLRRSWSG
jgi:hypothetical protein